MCASLSESCGIVEAAHARLLLSTLENKRILSDNLSNYVSSLAFVPDCGNKYLIAGSDDGIKIFDFEKAEVRSPAPWWVRPRRLTHSHDHYHHQLLQVFNELYSSFCDCIKFIKSPDLECGPEEHYLLTRGCELVLADGTALKENMCHLRKLRLPREPGDGGFELHTIKAFRHPEYASRRTSSGHAHGLDADVACDDVLQLRGQQLDAAAGQQPSLRAGAHLRGQGIYLDHRDRAAGWHLGRAWYATVPSAHSMPICRLRVLIECRHRGRREGHCIPSSAAGAGHVQRWYHCPRAGLRCQFDG